MMLLLLAVSTLSAGAASARADDAAAAAAAVWAQREAAACAGVLPADHVKAPLPGLGEASFLLILTCGGLTPCDSSVITAR